MSRFVPGMSMMGEEKKDPWQEMLTHHPEYDVQHQHGRYPVQQVGNAGKPWQHPSKDVWGPPPPKPKSKKKGRIFVDWERIGAVDVTPEGGKYSEKQLGIKPTPAQKREHDWQARLERLSTAMCYLTEWCWEPLLHMHPEDKVATHDILARLAGSFLLPPKGGGIPPGGAPHGVDMV